MSRAYTYLIALSGAVCIFFVLRLFFFTDLTTRTFPGDVLQGVLVGFGGGAAGG